MRTAILAGITLFVAASASAFEPKTIEGSAQVVSWNSELKVVELCDSKQRYQLVAFTSAAAAASLEVDRAIEADPSPLLIELIAFPASLPSNAERAPDVANALSVGRIAVLERGTCN